MAIKGKTKKTAGSRPRAVARAPRVDVKRRKRRRVRLDAFSVLLGLFAVTLVVVGVWALWRTLKPPPSKDVSAYRKDTEQAVESLQKAGGDLEAAVTKAQQAGDPGKQAATTAASVRTGVDTAKSAIEAATATGTLSLARQMELAAAWLLTESADTFAVAGRDGVGDDLRQGLARKAGREQRVGEGLLDAGSRLVAALPRNGIDEEASDVPNLGKLPLAEAPPLGGTPKDTGDPVLKPSEATQGVKGYADGAKKALERLDAALKNMGDTVSAMEAGGAPEALQAEAGKWLQAAQDAAVTLAKAKRPDGAAAADVALRDAMWMYDEAARSFASAAAVPSLRVDLILSGKRLRLLADQLRAAAAGELRREGKVTLPAPPASGFDPSLIAPPAPPVGEQVPGGIPGGDQIPGGIPGGDQIPGGIPGGFPGQEVPGGAPPAPGG